VFLIRISGRVKDYQGCGRVSFKGIFSAVAILCFFFFFFCIEGGRMGFYFFFEATLIPTLWLILKWGYQPERLQAGVFIIIYTAGASVPLLVSLVYIEEICKRDSFILGKVSCDHLLIVPSWVWGFTILGFLVKVPIYGFHVWLPKAHVEAPLSGSMLLAGVLLKLGGFGMIRLIWTLGIYMNDMFFFLTIWSLWGGVVCCCACLTQCDMKSIIAYSSVGHMSMVVGSLLRCYPLGKLGAECIMFAHGICSPCLFALAASSYDGTNSRNITINKRALQLFPMFCFFWFMFSAANIGCPPSLNYFSEVVCFRAIKEMSYVFIVPIGLMCQLSCFYIVFLFGYSNHGGVSSTLRPKSSLRERYLRRFLMCLLLLFLGFFFLDFFL